jgi:serine/threonine protein phosphatase PrpC
MEMRTKKTISIVALTDQGLVREHNEDRHLVVDSPGGSLLILADGMGGTNAGEVAAGIAVAQAKEYFFGTGDVVPGENGASRLKPAILDAHYSILQAALADPDLQGMGTTLLLGWIAGGRLTIAWSGDSRCYHYRSRVGIRRLSKDHSLVQILVEEGLLDDGQAFGHPLGNIVTQAVGDTGKPPEPDTATLLLEKEDLVLFCSDGLNGMLTDAEIESILREKGRNLSRCARALIKRANEAGGADNITVLLAKI